MLIKDIAQDEKPRERMLIYGKEMLSNEELLAIILRCGTKNSSSKALAGLILKEFKNVENLKMASINKLCEIKGIGKAKAIEILASLELGKRVYYLKNKNEIIFNNTKKIYEYFKGEFVGEKQEKFYALYLDTKCKILTYKLLFIGSVNSSTIHPREIFKEAFITSASSIICIHNHPSGDETPSKVDIEVTNNLVEIGNLIGIKVIDHIIIGCENYYSFYEKMNNK